MGILKRSLIFLMFFTISASCFAKQITVQVVQHNSATEVVSDASLIVEDELLNGFFDFGYIVTNSPAVISESQSEDLKLYNLGIGDASEGYSDFFVQIKLFYEKSEDERKTSLVKVDWTLASAVTGETIIENSIVRNSDVSNIKDLRLVSSNLIKEIKKAIKA